MEDNIIFIPDGSEALATVKELDAALLVLRQSLGKLREAMERAFAPLATVLLPAVNKVIYGLVGFFNDMAAVLAGVFGLVRKDADRTVRATGSAIKRSLAGFDRLERLSGQSGSSTVTLPGGIQELPERLKPIVEKLRSLLKPLQELDLSAAEAAFHRLKTAIESISRRLSAGLEWLWFNIFVPMSQWGAEQALPVFLDMVTALLKVLGATITAVQPVLSWLWTQLLQPMGRWTGQALISALEFVTDKLEKLANWIYNNRTQVEGFTAKLEGLRQYFARLCDQLDLWNRVSSLFRTGMQTLSTLAGNVKGVFSALGATISSVRDNLAGIFSGLLPGFKSMANSALGVLNKAIKAAESGVNAMVSTLNSFRVNVPDWIPGIGGRVFGITASKVSFPTIPYLAKGAVLPANKPFLAMVGDQRHGTNVEAPLSVIEEAVAGVLRSERSGQQTQTALLQAILSAIEGISVGDEVIGRAARRYENRMAVLGGVL